MNCPQSRDNKIAVYLNFAFQTGIFAAFHQNLYARFSPFLLGSYVESREESDSTIIACEIRIIIAPFELAIL